MDKFKLTGKVAIITGAASGIGLATALLYLEADVLGLVLVDLSMDALTRSFASVDPSRIELLALDVTEEANASAYVKCAVDRWGKLDIAFLNAGIGSEEARDPSVWDVAHWEIVMKVNGRGVFVGVKAAFGAMKLAGSGSIIITSSQWGMAAAPRAAAYSASKFAARGLMLSAAEEMAGTGVRINCLCPGPVETPMTGGMTEKKIKWMQDQIPLGRLGKPEELASAALFLASDASSFCHALSLKVDGGYASV